MSVKETAPTAPAKDTAGKEVPAIAGNFLRNIVEALEPSMYDTEVLAASIYLASRNLLAIALLNAGWVALVVAAIMPIRL